jgi:hypothetical protein
MLVLIKEIISFIEYAWFPFSMFCFVAWLMLKVLWDA